MFGRVLAVLAAAISLSGSATAKRAVPVADARVQGAALAQQCAGRDGWSDPAPPARIHGNTYYVGTCGISVLLVTSPRGHVLVDGATAEAAPSILSNIRALGFDPRDIRIIVGSHEHLDHMGGFAALKAATGARLLVRAPAKRVVETGQVETADPQSGVIAGMVPVAIDGVLIDGQRIRIGNIVLTVVATPGHTDGGTSWTWRSCERTQCATIAYVDSLSAVSADGYRFINHPERVAPFRATFDRVAALKCDVLVTPHPGVSNLFERLSGNAPLVDRDGCIRLADAMRKRLDDRLAKERGQ
jgi:metallo-beta-lactamase class B